MNQYIDTASSPSQGTWPSTNTSTLFIMSSHQEQPSISGVGLMLSLLLSVCYSLYNYWCGMNDSSLIIEKRLKCWQTLGWMPQVLDMGYIEWESCLLFSRKCMQITMLCNECKLCKYWSPKIGQQEISAGSCFQSCKWHTQQQTC